MIEPNPMCLNCKCLDTTSLTKSGFVCLTGGNLKFTSDCDLFLRKHPPVNDIVNCIKTLVKDNIVIANAGEVCSVRQLHDGQYVTSSNTDNNRLKITTLCLASGDEFNEHFEAQKLIAATWVLLDANGTKGLHKACGSPVYESSDCSRRCIDKNCMGSYYGIDIMENLVAN